MDLNKRWNAFERLLENKPELASPSSYFFELSNQVK
jgi:hypothetical protein